MSLSFTARFRSWVFILYNPTAVDESLIKSLGAIYGVYSYSNIVSNGAKPCITGYIKYTHAHTLRSLRKKLPFALWSLPIGTLSVHRDHVISEGQFVEFVRNVHGEVVVISDQSTVCPAPRALGPCTKTGHLTIPCCTLCQLM